MFHTGVYIYCRCGVTWTCCSNGAPYLILVMRQYMRRCSLYHDLIYIVLPTFQPRASDALLARCAACTNSYKAHPRKAPTAMLPLRPCCHMRAAIFMEAKTLLLQVMKLIVTRHNDIDVVYRRLRIINRANRTIAGHAILKYISCQLWLSVAEARCLTAVRSRWARGDSWTTRCVSGAQQLCSCRVGYALCAFPAR